MLSIARKVTAQKTGMPPSGIASVASFKCTKSNVSSSWNASGSVLLTHAGVVASVLSATLHKSLDGSTCTAPRGRDPAPGILTRKMKCTHLFRSSGCNNQPHPLSLALKSSMLVSECALISFFLKYAFKHT
jgi:hypothetical protein